jgi:superfamily II DNA or RNA helicase
MRDVFLQATPSSEAPPPPPARKAALRRLLLGFTATPFRHDKKALGDFFDLVLRERNLKWGILHGWLVDVHVFRVRTSISLDDVAARMGDLAEGQLQKAVNVQERNTAAVKVGAICG